MYAQRLVFLSPSLTTFARSSSSCKKSLQLRSVSSWPKDWTVVVKVTTPKMSACEESLTAQSTPSINIRQDTDAVTLHKDKRKRKKSDQRNDTGPCSFAGIWWRAYPLCACALNVRFYLDPSSTERVEWVAEASSK